MGTPNLEQSAHESVNNESESNGLNPKLMNELSKLVFGASTEDSSVAPQDSTNESE